MARPLPRITKTHRWDRTLFARVEALAQRTGRPVQHVLDDAVALGLEQIEDQIDARMRDMTPAEAWEGFVGNQSPDEFWQISQEQGAQTYDEAAERYVRELPHMFRDEWATWQAGEFPDLSRLARLLARYLEENLGPLE